MANLAIVVQFAFGVNFGPPTTNQNPRQCLMTRLKIADVKTMNESNGFLWQKRLVALRGIATTAKAKEGRRFYERLLQGRSRPPSFVAFFCRGKHLFKITLAAFLLL